MDTNNWRLIFATIGVWILSLEILNLDQLTLNSALLVSLIILNLGWTLKLNNDMNSNRSDIKVLMQRIADHLDREEEIEEEKNDRRRKANHRMDRS